MVSNIHIKTLPNNKLKQKAKKSQRPLLPSQATKKLHPNNGNDIASHADSVSQETPEYLG